MDKGVAVAIPLSMVESHQFEQLFIGTTTTKMETQKTIEKIHEKLDEITAKLDRIENKLK